MENPFDQYDKRRHQRLARWLRELRAWRNVRVAPIRDWQFDAGDGQTRSLRLGEAWPVVATPVKLTATATVPDDWAGQPVEVELWLGGEGFVRFTPGFQSGLNPFHHDFRLSGAAAGGETVQIEAEVVPKGMFGSHVHAPAIDRAHLVVPCVEVRALETDLRMLVETAAQLQEAKHEAFPLLIDLVEAAYRELAPAWPTDTTVAMTRYVSGDLDGGNTRTIGLGDYGQAAFEGTLIVSGIWHIPPPAATLPPLPEAAYPAITAARETIAEGLAEIRRRYPPVGELVLSGHAHIDLAWLWPLAETRRKVQRTFSSVLRLMEQYADFTFNQSSAQAYAWLEEDDPTLLEGVTARVAEGRWEPVGGSWAEPDCQVTGGEAFVRQLFYGQRYFQARFGVRNTVAWLPDVFGFSAGIPQLLRGAGLDKFFTTKLNWNEANTFPYDLYEWEGIDGSRVLAHSFYNPGHGYNGNIAPLDTFGTWKHFRGKRHHDQGLLAFGWGDGGGGPSEQMLEQYDRIKEFPVLPRLRMGKVEEFFAALPREGLPLYVGEQYLELHRATLTTQGLTKQLNRQAEHRLVEAEAFSTLAGSTYPHETLDAAWKTLLLHQFHDILPGSSIHEVYEDTHPALREVVTTAAGIRDEALATLAGGSSVENGAGAFAVGNVGLGPRALTVLLPEGTGPVATSDGTPVPT
ncbi:MAG: alpha-mannosidase, partial [Chloroflexota bacterium]|nr:alpha-mannosidase [Chloroflexota bacterium]